MKVKIKSESNFWVLLPFSIYKIGNTFYTKGVSMYEVLFLMEILQQDLLSKLAVFGVESFLPFKVLYLYIKSQTEQNKQVKSASPICGL